MTNDRAFLCLPVRDMLELATQAKPADGAAPVRGVRDRTVVALPVSTINVRAVPASKRGSGKGAAGVARVSEGEETLALHIRAEKLPEPVREYRFAPDRKWRFDFAWPDEKLAVEVEGGVWSGGRHTRGAGFLKDAEKYNRAALMGWRVLRFDTAQVRDGTAIAAVREALA